MTLSAGDRFILLDSGDGQRVPYKLLRTKATGERFILALTGDGQRVPVRVRPLLKEERQGFLGLAGDGQRVPVEHVLSSSSSSSSSSSGGGPATDCDGCDENCCDGEHYPSFVVSGFTGDCGTQLNGTYTFNHLNCEGPEAYADCQKTASGGSCLFIYDKGIAAGVVWCDGGNWNVCVRAEVGGPGGGIYHGQCYPCALTCANGMYPTGSGVLVGSDDCNGQSGSFTLS